MNYTPQNSLFFGNQSSNKISSTIWDFYVSSLGNFQRELLICFGLDIQIQSIILDFQNSLTASESRYILKKWSLENAPSAADQSQSDQNLNSNTGSNFEADLKTNPIENLEYNSESGHNPHQKEESQQISTSIAQKWEQTLSKIEVLFGKIKDKKTINCQAQIRYRQAAVPCLVSNPLNQAPNTQPDHQKNKNGLEVKFVNKVRAISPGQASVFYLGDYLLGGAFIDKVLD